MDWLAISPPGHIYHQRLQSTSTLPEVPSGLRGTPESEEISAGTRSQPERCGTGLLFFTWVPQSKFSFIQAVRVFFVVTDWWAETLSVAWSQEPIWLVRASVRGLLKPPEVQGECEVFT